MSVLIILLVLGIWRALLYNAGYYAGFAIERKWIRQLVGVTSVIALTTLVLWDEIVGTREFERICAAGNVYQIAPEAVGKKFDLKSRYTDRLSVQDTVRPIEQENIAYIDVATGAVMATSKAFFAKGGWMIRNGFLIDPSGGKGPLFGRSQCFPWGVKDQQIRLDLITNKRVD